MENRIKISFGTVSLTFCLKLVGIRLVLGFKLEVLMGWTKEHLAVMLLATDTGFNDNLGNIPYLDPILIMLTSH